MLITKQNLSEAVMCISSASRISFRTSRGHLTNVNAIIIFWEDGSLSNAAMLVEKLRKKSEGTTLHKIT